MDYTDDVKKDILKQIHKIKKLKFLSEISLQANEDTSNIEKQIIRDITKNTTEPKMLR